MADEQTAVAQNQQRIIRFFGTVQGVGFRWLACRVAKSYDIRGYVRNCPDGTVECVAEGPADQIDGFIGDLKERMSGYIRKVQQQTAPAAGTFDSFTVRY
ncbi:MAG: acylphosphatase [Planctomycetaceae bacterium]|nr:acylphosphatase [Planctomycetaceae bacterium]